ncbi:uncharacterized protein LOC110686805 [Chenopodium quinoa]|uniref:uncharacterized protein LOC110686805 n=1 Tax=Chenopodium quinoa TaxID=63459 RepID=UPI000B790441|nr:uncharacterized protein LOC110686805 [Chenopodium quinoa]
MKESIKQHIKHCTVCQQYKYDAAAYPGILQPLPLPEQIWEEVTMDFIEGLPNSQGRQFIMVVVDRLSKYAYFIALSHPYYALKVARAYLDHVFKLHGFPKSIISDRDKRNLKNGLSGYLLLSSDAIDRSLQQRNAAISMLKENLLRAQNRIKQLADKHRSERQFAVGDWIVKMVGEVAYTLQLPSSARIHPTFHVSLVKKHHGPTPAQPTPPDLPNLYPDQTTIKVPIAVLDKRSVKRQNNAVVQWLVQWDQWPIEEATWVDAEKLEKEFPTFDPWGQGSFNGGSIDAITVPLDTVPLVNEMLNGLTLSNNKESAAKSSKVTKDQEKEKNAEEGMIAHRE